MFSKFFRWQTSVPTLFLLLSVLATVAWYFVLPALKSEKQDLVVAFVVPGAGQSEVNTTEIKDAVNLIMGRYAKQFANRPYSVSVKYFDEDKRIDQALATAQNIAEQSNVIGVIGYEDAAVAAAVLPVFKKHGLPFLGFSHLGKKGKKRLPYFYPMTADDDLQGEFAVRYLRHLTHTKNILVLSSNERSSSARIKSLSDYLKADGVDSVFLSFSGEGLNKQQLSSNITTALKGRKFDLVLLDANPEEMAKAASLLYKTLGKSFSLLGYEEMASPVFVAKLQQEMPEGWKEALDSVRFITPYLQQLIQGEAGQFVLDYQAMFGRVPNDGLLQAFDAIQLLVAVALDASGSDFDFKGRANVDSKLQRINASHSSAEGVMGRFFFSADGRLLRSLAVGHYQEGMPVAFPRQLSMAADTEAGNGRTPHLSGMPLSIVNLIFSGISPQRWTEAGDKGQEIDSDFVVWLRSEASLDHLQVMVSGAGLEDRVLVKPVREIGLANGGYKEYRVTRLLKPESTRYGTFSGDQFSFLLGLKLDHAVNFRIVPDYFGMKAFAGLQLLQSFKREGVLDSPADWVSAQYHAVREVGQQETGPGFVKTILSPEEVHAISFSMLRTHADGGVGINLMAENPGPLLVLTALLMICMIYLVDLKQGVYYPILFPLISVAALIMLSLFESVLLAWHGAVSSAFTQFLLQWAVLVWWISGSLLLLLGVHVLVWDRMERKHGKGVPQILKGFVSVLLIITMGFFIAAFVFKLSVTAALAASGAVIVPIGFALKPLILDLFSGLAINMESPFRVKDWIKVNIRGVQEAVIGRVEEITWRSLRLWTAENNLVTIPNHKVAELSLVNFSLPNSHSRFDLTFTVGYEVPTEQVLRLASNALKELALSGLILDYPKKSKIKVNAMVDRGVEYLLRYYLDLTKGSPSSGRDNISRAVLNHLSHFGIRPSYHVLETQDSYTPTRMPGIEEKMVGHSLVEVKTKALGNINLFHHLDADELVLLAEKSELIRVDSDAEILRQGDEGDSMYVIIEGLVGVDIRKEDGTDLRVATLKPGNYFGEMSLMLREPRSATVVAIRSTKMLEIGFEAMRLLLQKHPEVAIQISEQIDSRVMHNNSKLSSASQKSVAKKSLGSVVLDKIRGLFGLSA